MQAADLLHKTLAEWAVANVAECPTDAKVVVCVYANIKGLADVCTRAGSVNAPAKIEAFARGFTRGKTLFDFIDIGAGGSGAYEKIDDRRYT